SLRSAPRTARLARSACPTATIFGHPSAKCSPAPASAGTREAAVDRNDRSGDPGAGPGCEEDRDAGHVLVATDPAERDQARDPVAEALEGAPHHAAREGARRDGVHRDPLLRELAGEHAGQMVDRGLARTVGPDVERG